ncbi:nicotinamide mononucleotide transporter [Luteibacter sp. Sphag1AF]|uniref:nicotinamide riboside transporter PnuC n=1 Tax=Luteibacter sp. Sphag1AF TaxID=2587031 RepID=UPI001619F052|nr:nicotinamide riboside transporter PnuC [Luteibacter sp. Sphag1AF]MBB3228054.1 nicotinamide mononucleotide transporter [Luteibacter sp. Sphag1AF]
MTSELTLYEGGAALASALGVWLTARRHPWCWPVGLVSVAAYAWIFVDARLYSDAGLQVVFAILLIYGWQRWLRHLGDDGRVQVAPLPRRDALLHLAIGVAGALCLGYAMHRWTDAALPWLDAMLAALSLVAQWWQARRHVATWWLWIAVDVVYVGLYVYKDLFVTALLYGVFVGLAIHGWREWRQQSLRPHPKAA